MTLATALSNVLAKHFGHIRCLSHCVGEAFQNVIFYVSEVIDIIYIYKLSKKISYHNFLVRKIKKHIYLIINVFLLHSLNYYTFKMIYFMLNNLCCKSNKYLFMFLKVYIKVFNFYLFISYSFSKSC